MRHFLFALCLTLVIPVLPTLSPDAWAASSSSEKKEGEEATLPKIDMEPFKFSLIDRGHVRGQASISLTLVIKNPKNMNFVRTHLPQLRSDFLTALTVLANQRLDPNRPVDPDIISAYLAPYADYRLGTGKVAVYVKEAMITPQ